MSRYELRFPVQLDTDDVSLLLGGLAIDLAPRGLFRPRPVADLSVVTSSGQIHHYLDIAEPLSATIRSRFQATLSNVRIEDVETRQPKPPTLVWELRINTLHRPLRTDRPDSTSAAIISALATASPRERIQLQWLLTGARTPAPARRIPAASTPSPWWPAHTRHSDSEDLRQERLKQSQPLLAAVIRIAVWTGSTERAAYLAGGILRALGSTRAPGVSLRSRRGRQTLLRTRFMESRVPHFDWPVILNADELAALLGWPLGELRLPGLTTGVARQLPPALSLARSEDQGPPLADPNFSGQPDPIVLRDADRLMHTSIIGPTGSGKSVTLGHIGVSDMEAGHCLIAIDPKGDFVDYLADQVPEHRRDDVIIFDPADSAPVGYNPLRAQGVAGHLVVDQIDHIFARLFGSNYGPRSGDINRAALLTLMAASSAEHPMTMAELPDLLTNPAFRKTLVSRLSDPALIELWRWYEQLGNAQASTIAPLLNKLRALLLRSPVRNVLAQADPGWTFDEVLSRQRILLVRLSPGEIGTEAAQLLGSLLVAGIWQAAQARTRLPSNLRRPAMLLIDEWQNFINLPTPIGAMLAQARGLGLGITLANQQLGQLSSSLQAELFANARSKVIFQANSADARTLAPHLPGVTAEDLQHLGQFEVVTQLAVGNTVAPPATGRTRPPAPGLGVADALRAVSRDRYGTPVEAIEEQLRQRRAAQHPINTPLGEIPRPKPDGEEPAA